MACTRKASGEFLQAGSVLDFLHLPCPRPGAEKTAFSVQCVLGNWRVAKVITQTKRTPVRPGQSSSMGMNSSLRLVVHILWVGNIQPLVRRFLHSQMGLCTSMLLCGRVEVSSIKHGAAQPMFGPAKSVVTMGKSEALGTQLLPMSAPEHRRL